MENKKKSELSFKEEDFPKLPSAIKIDNEKLLMIENPNNLILWLYMKDLNKYSKSIFIKLNE